ncbi:hypothetical protein IAR55_000941 [Kwoniella newhampshirensis]|uniref:Uncharacterized protein n=1 Tax=Kwoniella newhampshirensis TaxID=1651941 RepID=A0AAW0Z4A0_9TREE
MTGPMNEPLDQVPVPHPPSRRHSHSASLAPQQRLRGASTSAKRSMSMSAAPTLQLSDWDEEDEYDDGDADGEEWDRGMREPEVQYGAGTGAGRKRKKRDEPMSPVVVVLYVIALYLIFQILTRSDDMEILSHLPPTSSILQSQSHSPKNPLDLHQYHLPYQLPHIPNPIPSIPPSSSTSPSIWRTIASIVLYPIYLAVAIIVTPLPFLMVGLRLLLEVLGTILYPLTVTGRILFRTFVKGPWGVFRGIMEIFYPVYVFVGGVLGVGCVLGLGAGWVGKVILDSLLRWKERKGKNSARTRKGDSLSTNNYIRPTAMGNGNVGKSRTSKSRRSDLPIPFETSRVRSKLYSHPQRPREKITRLDLQDKASRRPIPRSLSPIQTSRRHRSPEAESDESTDYLRTPAREIVHDRVSLFPPSTLKGKGKVGRVDYKEMRDKEREGEGRATAREPVVLGVRRRGVREGSGYGR